MGRYDFSIIRIIERTLNYVDPRLINHGKRVAYLTYQVLRAHGGYSEREIRDAAILGLIHDIGAYKTEEIDKMVQFETNKVWEHSIYGYLFIKYFSPLQKQAAAILFHHANVKELTYLHPPLRDLAQVIYVADRFDIQAQTGDGNRDHFLEHFAVRRGRQFYPHIVDMFFMDGWEGLFEGMEDDEAFERILYEGDFSDREVEAFIRMIVLSIDFRSPQTVTHTFTTAAAAKYLADRLGLNGPEMDRLFIGSMFHDLGKIGVPLEVLEKPGKLTDEEMRRMQNHVRLTRDILSGIVDNVALNLSVRHHEKPNGAGYPDGLRSSDLTPGQRIVAVADIFSALCTARSYKEPYPKEKVLGIMQDMSEKGMLDERVFAVATQNFDDLRDEVDRIDAPVIDAYELMAEEYAALMQESERFRDGCGQGEIVI